MTEPALARPDDEAPASGPGRRRIVFLDVDGTILSHDGRIAASTPEAVRAARAQGHLVLLCTGRAASDLDDSVRAIEVDGLITNGGASAVVDGRRILAARMPREVVDRVLVHLELDGTGYLLQTHTAVHADDTARRLMAEVMPGTELGDAASGPAEGPEDAAASPLPTSGRRLLPVSAADLDDVAKVVFVSLEPGAVERARRALGEAAVVIPGSFPWPTDSHGEIHPHGVSKGIAIRAVLDELGLDAADAVGIGDSWNDLDMFEVCGLAIAMSHADAEVRARADDVTTDVLDDGISTALRRHGIIPDPEAQDVRPDAARSVR